MNFGSVFLIFGGHGFNYYTCHAHDVWMLVQTLLTAKDDLIHDLM